MGESNVIKARWLRTANSRYVYPATEELIKRNDMYPCDISGNFMATGTPDMPVVEAEPARVDAQDETEGAKENSTRAGLLELAKSLGIKSPHLYKDETLLQKINEAEEAAASGGKEEPASA